MRHWSIMLMASIGLAACTLTPDRESGLPEELLSGDVLFGETIDVSDIHSDQVMALNDELRDYVDSKVGKDRRARARLENLLRGMLEDGLLALDYNQDRTFPAIETFNTRQGNCLSFSLLFAALARDAGLELQFQMVDIPPSFRADGEIILLDKHINVRVKGLRGDRSIALDYIVDFNAVDYKGNYDTRTVDDSYAIALYYSNLAVESMQADRPRDAFRYLKKGIESDPGVAEIWVNLGVLYSRNQHYAMAEQAYGQALSLQPSNRSALLNMANALQKLGRQEESDEYTRRVRYYRDLHPYYHYSKAKIAARAAEYEDAIIYLNDAIKLKKDEHQFYFLRGLVNYQLENYELAEKDYARARATAADEESISKYTSKLQNVASRLN